jgi:hypothetical protein
MSEPGATVLKERSEGHQATPLHMVEALWSLDSTSSQDCLRNCKVAVIFPAFEVNEENGAGKENNTWDHIAEQLAASGEHSLKGFLCECIMRV